MSSDPLSADCPSVSPMEYKLLPMPRAGHGIFRKDSTAKSKGGSHSKGILMGGLGRFLGNDSSTQLVHPKENIS